MPAKTYIYPAHSQALHTVVVTAPDEDYSSRNIVLVFEFNKVLKLCIVFELSV